MRIVSLSDWSPDLAASNGRYRALREKGCVCCRWTPQPPTSASFGVLMRALSAAAIFVSKKKKSKRTHSSGWIGSLACEKKRLTSRRIHPCISSIDCHTSMVVFRASIAQDVSSCFLGESVTRRCLCFTYWVVSFGCL